MGAPTGNMPLPDVQQLYLFGIAALLGGLIGLERQVIKSLEESGSNIGVRTFIFISLAGALSAMISSLYTPWFIAVGFASISALIFSRYRLMAQCGDEDLGITTEVTELLTFLIGALVYWGHVRISIALAVTVTVVLSIKSELHKWTRKMGADDIRAILKFSVLTFVILPILPNKAVDPWGLFNPYEVWIMVVLVSGVSFIGYVLLKYARIPGGIEWSGAIGGLMSSTATTWNYAKRSKTSMKIVPHLAMGILLACAVMYPRLFVIVAVAGPCLVKPLALPFALMFAAGVIASYAWWLRYRSQSMEQEPIDFRNPVEIGAAITFGVIFTGIKVITILAERYFGDTGLMVLAGISGVAELDAIALSISRMVAGANPTIAADVGAQAIVVATVSNSLVKAGIALFVGSRGMKKPVVAGLVSMAIVGAVYLLVTLT